jgi:hypothetical protein
MKRAGTAVALAAAVLVAAPGAGQAATVKRAVGADGGALDIVAGAGEENRIAIGLGTETATVTDAGAPLVATGEGCEQVDERTVRCSLAGVTDVIAALADGGERFEIAHDERARAVGAVVDAGPGDDAVGGGRGEDFLDGGGGRDMLTGNGGDDHLLDGDGGAAAFDDDVLDGGEGADDVLYVDRDRGVVVRLAQGFGTGGAGERDQILSIEGATGGRGDDQLVGDAGRNDLRGGPGGDEVAGGRGADVLSGDGGSDLLNGGAGADQLYAGERGELGPEARDDVRCGTGRDLVFTASPDDLLLGTCDALLGVFAHASTPLPVRPFVDPLAGVGRHTVLCPRIGNRRRSACTARMTIRDARGRLVARGRGGVVTRPARFVRIRYARFAVPLELTAHGRRALRRGRPLVVRNRVVSTARIPGLGTFRRTASYTFAMEAG